MRKSSIIHGTFRLLQVDKKKQFEKSNDNIIFFVHSTLKGDHKIVHTYYISCILSIDLVFVVLFCFIKKKAL